MRERLHPAAGAALAALLVAALAGPGEGALAPGEPTREPPPAAGALSLAEAIALAEESSPVLAAARQRAAAAGAEARTTERGVNWPRLALSSGWTATDTPASVFAQKLNAGLFTSADFAIDSLNSPEARAHLASGLALEVPLDLFGKASPAARAARAGADAAAQSAREVELDVRLRVVQAWHRAAVAAHAVGVTQRTAAGAAAREAQIEAQAAAGAALRAELLRARARRRSLEAELAARRGEVQSAAAGLALAIGVPGPVVPALEAQPEPPAAEAPGPTGSAAGAAFESAVPGPLGDWLERVADRPAVGAARSALDAAEQGSLEATRAVRPDLTLSAQLQDDRGPLAEGQTTGAAGVFLRWSLFDPQRDSRRATAESTRAAAASNLAAAEAQSRFEIESAWHAAVAARQRWLAASGGTEEGLEALRVIRERRAAGVATLTDELETEAAALAAELAELTAAADAAVARAALERAAGVSFVATETAP
jgi:outer membrane protein TolC